jgi:hypothetical protein
MKPSRMREEISSSRISGNPLLESRSDAKWGHAPEYQAYEARTPVLWLQPPAAT